MRSSTFLETFGKSVFYRLVNKFNNQSYFLIIVLSLVLRVLVILISTHLGNLSSEGVMPDWQRKETKYLLEYIKEMRSNSNSPFEGSFNRLNSGFISTSTSNFNSSDNFYRDLAPAVSYCIYMISWLSSKLFHFETHDLTDKEKTKVLLLAKCVLLLWDSVLMIFCTSVYIRLAYSVMKRQIRNCFMGIILLSPIFFLREYLHLDFHNLGYQILFLIIFAADSNEPLVVGSLSAVLVNFHKTYWLSILFIFGGMILNMYRTRQSKEFDLRKKMMYISDIVQLLGSFLLVFLALVLPWLHDSSDYLASLETLIGRPIKHLLVGIHNLG